MNFANKLRRTEWHTTNKPAYINKEEFTASIAQYLCPRRYFPKFERAIVGKKNLSFVSVEYDQGCMETL